MTEITWNYLPPFSELGSYQEDWNQTLLTKINYLFSITETKTDIIKIPNKFKNLIKTLLYFDETHNTLKNYVVEFFDSNENCIYIEKHKLNIINYDTII